jgi:hypothetical protein
MSKIHFLGEYPEKDLAEVVLVQAWADDVARYADLPNLDRKLADMATGGAGVILRHFFHINPAIQDLDFSCLDDAYSLYLIYATRQTLNMNFARQVKDRCEAEGRKIVPYVARMHDDGKTGTDYDGVPAVFLVHGHAISMLDKMIQWEMAGRTDLRDGLKLLFNNKNKPAGPAAPGPA